ncbi:MAG: aminoacyl-tRNA hydrolase [Deltaproteobacteria bacterium]|nr:aminoacyl-tRNA hydrolase [Deltaproteobacteria bacterium]
MKLIVGLGNPGDRYAGTRHNIGFMVVGNLAEKNAVRIKKKGYQGCYGVGRVTGEETTLLLPQTYMNLSGASVASAVRVLKLEGEEDVIVVHDDVDLPFGRLRVRTGGGHGGHNGIRNICQVLGHGDFTRVKLGIGRPHPEEETADFVLRNFSPQERKVLGKVLEVAVEAVECILRKGAETAMNEFNNCDILNLVN